MERESVPANSKDRSGGTMTTIDDHPFSGALRDERARLEAVLAAAADGVLLERDGRWYANGAAQRMLALQDELLPSPEELGARFLDGTPIASGSIPPQRFRARLKALDGRSLVIEASWSAEPVPVFVFRDVTEDYRREHMNAEFLRTLLDTIPTPINVVDAESRRVISTNAAFLDLVELPLEEVLGALPPYAWWSSAEEARVLGSGVRYGRVFRRPDGHPVPVELELHAIRDADGAATSYLAVITDLSERRRLEQQLVQSGKLAAIGELAAGVAHEINNPLFAILGLLEFALKDVAEGTKTHERLDLARRTALEIKDIVRALLDFARENSEERHSVAVDDVVRETVELVSRTSATRGIELVERFGAGPFLVEGSPNQLKQVFLNLLANARQAMPGGGTITLRLERDGDWVNASVADTGEGIAPDTLPRIFEPFFTTKRGQGGTGLGLSVSLGIAEAHGGALTAASEPGSGAVFTLRLPAREAA
jgi:PAS domain S-box-containing protein